MAAPSRAARRPRCRAWVQRTGSVTAEQPGRLRFGAMGTGTRLAFPLGTVFGEPWIHLGADCIVGEQVTLTAGLMPDLDLGADPIRASATVSCSVAAATSSPTRRSRSAATATSGRMST